MRRMEINSLKTLADSADGGGYTLPAELLDALRTYRRVTELEYPDAQHFDAEGAATRLVSALAAGENPNIDALVSQASEAERDSRAIEQVRTITALALERAAFAATALCSDLTERIIRDHLRPAFDTLLEDIQDKANALAAVGLDPHALITAPAKARHAYVKLPELAARHRTIWNARHLVNTIGARKAEHDVAGLFTEFADPLALRPGWKLPAPVPLLEAPTDVHERLLWLVSDAIAPGKPWLPTLAEQDAAWLEQFEASALRAAPWGRVVANA